MAHYSTALGQIHSQKARHNRVKCRHPNGVDTVHPWPGWGSKGSFLNTSCPPHMQVLGPPPAPTISFCSVVCQTERGSSYSVRSVCAGCFGSFCKGRKKAEFSGGVFETCPPKGKHTSSGWSKSLRCRSWMRHSTMHTLLLWAPKWRAFIPS